MKKVFTIIPLLAPLTIYAAESTEHGFSGELTLLMGNTNVTSNFNTDQNQKVGLLNVEAESNSEFLLAPLGQLRYNFGSNNHQQVFLGSSRADISEGDFVVELGYKYSLEEGSAISISYLPSLIAETWADPFIINQERQETDVTSNAFRVQYDRILTSNFSIDLAYYTVELDEEQSGFNQTGQIIGTLDRNGNGLYSKVSHTSRLEKTAFLALSLLYKNFDADGEAMSNSQLGVELSYKKLINRHALALTAKYKQHTYDETHPIFNLEQDDDEMNIFAAYEYSQFMDWDNVGFNAIVGYTQTNSNIDFYDEDSYLIGVGLSYKF